MNSLSSFFQMGGYGAYIWPCFGLSAILLIAITISTLRTLKANRKTLATMEASQHSKQAQNTNEA